MRKFLKKAVEACICDEDSLLVFKGVKARNPPISGALSQKKAITRGLLCQQQLAAYRFKAYLNLLPYDRW